jgi:invasion protein IalB
MEFGMGFVKQAGLAAAAAMLLCGQVFAQDETAAKPGAEAPKLPQWIVSCSNGNTQAVFRCAMQQTLFVSKTGQRVLSMTIEKGGKGYGAALLLPHGINFANGVTWGIDDGEKSQVAISNADQNGSYARFELTEAQIEAMKKGSILRVATQPMSGENLNIELTLAGFGDAFAILERN